MKPTRNKPPMKTPKKATSKTKANTDPVHVYLRIRPAELDNEVSCVKIISSTIAQLSTPECAVNYRPGNYKEMQYTFQHAFTEKATQTELFQNVALPLVADLIHGRNGLLLTYGVTGSGKTYTMIGEPQDGGILPRCLDVLFNSILEVQANKYILKPDKMNGFDVQDEADAMLDRQNEMLAQVAAYKTPKSTPMKRKPGMDVVHRTQDNSRVSDIDPDNTYAVFVTYVEIYNNSVYDLLDDLQEDASRIKSLQTKIIREDASHMMYIHGVTEVEVKSANEAFEIFYAGQRKKRMAQTTLNVESSRSHSVFTIRLVSAPLDSNGENIVLDKSAVSVSQLSLVDLAGSERTNRTNNTGQRLREAGNINNSLMTLRNCLEILRENQKLGSNKMVPYRDSRVTHLFKGYFDGEGQIRMVVCVNPRSDDYDETVQVMKFAEMTQEVQVARPTSHRVDLELMPGRRKANQIFKQAMENLEKNGADLTGVKVDLGLVYSLGGSFPLLQMSAADDDKLITDLAEFLKFRIDRWRMLATDTRVKMANFRSLLVNLERDSILLKQENSCLTAALDQERKKMETIESKLMSYETQLISLKRDKSVLDSERNNLKQELVERDVEVRQLSLEHERSKQKYGDQMRAEKERMTRRAAQRQRDKEEELADKMRGDADKLERIRQIAVNPATRSAVSKHVSRLEANRLAVETPTAARPGTGKKGGVAVSNPRYRRSRSVGDKWIDHRPAMTAPLGTVLQPSIAPSKTVRRLEMINANTTSKYCLTTQELDTDGELETRLYKGDVLPTCGGGAQVVFNDVELLRQESPTAPRKRSSARLNAMQVEDVQAKCSVSVEGRSKRARRDK